MTDGSGTTTYTWDALSRMTGVTDGGLAHVGYQYDLGGHQTGIVYPSGNTLVRTVDPAGRVTAQTDGSSRLTSFTYDADGNLTTIARPNGTTSRRTFDAADQLTRISDTGTAGGTILDLPYTYDGDGLVTSTNPLAGPSTGSQAYGYDAASRLTSATNSAASTGVPADGYAYDAADNLVRITTNGVDATLVHDAANQLTSVASPAGTVTYSNDARGDRTGWTDTAGNTAKYGYDQANRMTSSVGPPVTATNQLGAPSASVGYSYNGDGLRTQKRVAAGGSAVVLGETWDVSGPIPHMLVDNKVLGGTVSPETFVYAPDGTPLEQISGTPLFFHTDRLGSVRAVTNTAGQVVGSFNYDPYGRPVGNAPTSLTPLGFAGQYTDAETGLLYLRARYYDPTTGQFLTRDPLSSMTRSPYGYAGDSPLNAVDPMGLCRVNPVSIDFWTQGNCLSDGADDIAGAVGDLWNTIVDHAGDISAVAGTAALLVLPIPGVGEVASPILGAISVVTGAIATASDVANGEYLQAALDALGTLIGAGGLGEDVSSRLVMKAAQEAWDAGEAVLDLARTAANAKKIGAMLDKVGAALGALSAALAHSKGSEGDGRHTSGCP